ncbi:hypothetical protein JCM8097_008004 [Rhodosporidiobolus ruineniae]
MSSQTLMRCFTCGKETTTRCPLCSKAGMETAFCGKECQVAAWPAHSKVCGARANPFRWPVVSQKELEHLKAIAHEKDELTGQSLAESFKRLLGPQVPHERILNDLTKEPSPLPAALHAPLLAAARSAELGQYESALHASSTSSSPPPTPIVPLPLLRATNLAFNIYTLFTRKPGLWSSAPEASPWWTPLHARLVHLTIVHGVMCRAAEEGKEELREKTEKWYVEVEADLRKFLKSEPIGLSEAEVEDAVGDFLEAPTNQ